MRLLVDISGLAYRSAHKLTLSDRNGVPTNLVFGTLRSLEHLAELLDPEEVIVCWDSGHAARSQLYPEYKANRKNRDPEFKEDFDRQMLVLRELLETLPLVHVAEPGVEADDCIAALCEFMKPEVLAIVTGDQDLHQLASGPMEVVNHPEWKGQRHAILDYDGVPAKMKMKPDQIVTYKVLVGDSSDNIKGVLGLGDVSARRLLASCSPGMQGLQEIMREAKVGGVKLGRMSYEEALPIVKRNLKLIRLRDTPMLSKEQRLRIIGGYRTARLDRRLREAKLRELLTAHDFKSILRRFSRFTLNFKCQERISRTAEANHAQEEVHQADQEGRPLWRKVRRVKGASDSGDRQGTGDHHYVRRIRKVKDPSHQSERRWRRIRRVVGASRRQAGGGRGNQDDAEGGPAPPQHSSDGQRPQLDPPDGHPGPARAVPAIVEQARASRARAHAQRVSDLQEVPQPESVRRGSTLSLLSALHDDFEWLKGRPDADLKRIVKIIRWYERDETYSPSEEDAAFIEELHRDHGMELPEWMMTEQEKEDRATPVASMDYWDFASNAIANMGRRRR